MMSRAAFWKSVSMVAGAIGAAGLCGPAGATSVREAVFGRMPTGEAVKIFTLENDRGTSVSILTYGGTIQSVRMPDRRGHADDVVLGFDNLGQYLVDSDKGYLYFGATIGRYANRIAYGRFALDGHNYQLPISLGPHTLHGGPKGFDKRLWTVISTGHDAQGARLTLGLTSVDGDQGFPGTVVTRVEYALDNRNQLTLHFQATTDKPTVISLTSHGFWTLSGEGSGNIEKDVIQINADRYTPTDPSGIPTGELASVAGTPFDLRLPTRIGAHLRDGFPQLSEDHGYDKNFAINGEADHAPRWAATLFSPASGRQMEILTTQPGLQFYTANGLDGRYRGKSGKAYRQSDAVALEAEAFPDSPNHPQFPSVVLRPGQTYRQATIYRFSVH